MKKTGTVVYFSQRGFGFLDADLRIEGSKNKDFFFHITDISRLQTLPTGTRVSFEIGAPTPRHPHRAIRVEVIASADSAVKS